MLKHRIIVKIDTRLDQSIADWLSISKAKARKLIMAGAVRINGKPIRIPAKELPAGTVIEVRVDTAKLFSDATSRDRAFELTPDRILFEDEDLIAVDKPAGLPTHPTVDTTRDNLHDALRRYLGRRDGNADPYLGIHQRLDRDTSGVVLFTRTRRINAGVGKIFASHLATKVYQALTKPSVTVRAWTIRNYLGRISSRSKRSVYGAVDLNGELAETSFRVLAEYRQGLWIEAMPKTGRTHQIRVHLSEYGLPIFGDDLYGGGPAPRLMLHATELRFPHPLSHREVSIHSALPKDFMDSLRRMQTR